MPDDRFDYSGAGWAEEEVAGAGAPMQENIPRKLGADKRGDVEALYDQVNLLQETLKQVSDRVNTIDPGPRLSELAARIRGLQQSDRSFTTDDDHEIDNTPFGKVFRHVAKTDSELINVDKTGTHESPQDATYSGEHAEAARTGASDIAWDIEDQGEFDGYKISLVTGQAYYDASNETWYEYRTDFTYDSFGALVEVTSEYRVTIDIPEDC